MITINWNLINDTRFQGCLGKVFHGNYQTNYMRLDCANNNRCIQTYRQFMEKIPELLSSLHRGALCFDSVLSSVPLHHAIIRMFANNLRGVHSRDDISVQTWLRV